GGSAAVVGSAGGDAAAGDALAVTVDPRDAASADVVATLRSLHEVVGERTAADAETRAAQEEAADRLEAATAARAEAERRVADVDPSAAATGGKGGAGGRAVMPFGTWHARSGAAPG